MISATAHQRTHQRTPARQRTTARQRTHQRTPARQCQCPQVSTGSYLTLRDGRLWHS